MPEMSEMDEIYRLKEAQAVTSVRLANIETKLEEILAILKSHDDLYVRRSECAMMNNDILKRVSVLETNFADHEKSGNRRNSDFIYWIITSAILFAAGYLIKGA